MLWVIEAMIDGMLKTLARKHFSGKRVFLCQTPYIYIYLYLNYYIYSGTKHGTRRHKA